MEISKADSEDESFVEIVNQIKQFREDPKSFLDKVGFTKKAKKIKEYKEYINTLEQMPELILDKDLCKIAEEESKKLSEDENYNKYQIGEEFQNINIGPNFAKNEVALLALEQIEENDKIIQSIIINDLDEEKKGRIILTNKDYTHFGVYKSEEDSIILIFSKKMKKKKK